MSDGKPKTATLCDCERSHNGLGMAGRLCDCQDERPPPPGLVEAALLDESTRQVAEGESKTAIQVHVPWQAGALIYLSRAARYVGWTTAWGWLLRYASRWAPDIQMQIWRAKTVFCSNGHHGRSATAVADTPHRRGVMR